LGFIRPKDKDTSQTITATLSSSEISSLENYFERWSVYDIQSLINSISTKSEEFKRKWAKKCINLKEELNGEITTLNYSNLNVGVKNGIVNYLRFNIKNLPNEEIPVFKNINPYSTKSEIMSYLGQYIKFETGEYYNSRLIYTWALNDILDIRIAFNNQEKLTNIQIIKK